MAGLFDYFQNIYTNHLITNYNYIVNIHFNKVDIFKWFSLSSLSSLSLSLSLSLSMASSIFYNVVV